MGLGTWAIGGGQSWGESNEKESIYTIDSALDIGIDYIDTAPAYGNGLCESILGKALAGKRDKFFLATKCGLTWNYNNTNKTVHMERDGRVVRRDLESIPRQLEESLIRLKTDHVDMLLTHWPDPQVRVEETVEVLENLKREGKIRFYGACNTTTDIIDSYGQGLSMIQEKYSMLSRENNSLLEKSKKKGIVFQAYSAMERGLLSGKISEGTKIEGLAKNSIKYFQMPYRREVISILKNMQGIAENHRCEVVQIVLAWTIAKCGMVLCGARKPWQILENAKALSVLLTEDEICYIDCLCHGLLE